MSRSSRYLCVVHEFRGRKHYHMSLDATSINNQVQGLLQGKGWKGANIHNYSRADESLEDFEEIF